MLKKKQSNIFLTLSCLTLLFIAAQVIFFSIHYKVSELLDSLVQSSVGANALHMTIILPIVTFLIIQLFAYILFVMWTWFVSSAGSDFFNLYAKIKICFAFIVFVVNCALIISLNNYYFPNSFFASLIPTNKIILLVNVSLFFILAAIAYYQSFRGKRYIKTAVFFALLGLLLSLLTLNDKLQARAHYHIAKAKPDIILIGLDSLRPDFISYFSNSPIKTPHVDEFLKSAVIFSESYTPLARTFPAWMSILTAKYPIHHHARSNLGDPQYIAAEETLATKLKTAGYETIYATDEKRFSNITEQYGFDKIIGPRMGVDDFILGGLSDFPLTNLMVNTSLGRIFFPYNYANRAAAITYDPNTFLQLVKMGLAKRTDKPLFLAIHLCISHWPYTWADDHQKPDFTLPDRYGSSVSAIDKQLAYLLQILQQNGLLNHSLVVLLSDHGTTVGLHGDRITSEKNYRGDKGKLNWLPIYKDLQNDLALDTSYGQGSDILSLKQYHVLMAFRGYGIHLLPHQVELRSSLLDITPTILDFLHLAPIKNHDGISLMSCLYKRCVELANRPLFLETGFSIADIETNDIFIEKVVKHAIGVYEVLPNGQLTMKQAAEHSININKERAVLWGDWLLSRYPAQVRNSLPKNTQRITAFQNYVLPPFYVIANLKTGKWDIGLHSELAKQAPPMLFEQFKRFYGNEL